MSAPEGLRLVALTPEVVHALQELPTLLRRLKSSLEKSEHRTSGHEVSQREWLSKAEARQIAGVRDQDFIADLIAGRIPGARKVAQGRTGQWRIPRGALLEYAKTRRS